MLRRTGVRVEGGLKLEAFVLSSAAATSSKNLVPIHEARYPEQRHAECGDPGKVPRLDIPTLRTNIDCRE